MAAGSNAPGAAHIRVAEPSGLLWRCREGQRGYFRRWRRLGAVCRGLIGVPLMTDMMLTGGCILRPEGSA